MSSTVPLCSISARGLTRAGRGAGPSFIEAQNGKLMPSIPASSLQYHLQPRKFPRLVTFNVRVDSSLGSQTLPEADTDVLRTSVLADIEASVGPVPACSKVSPCLHAFWDSVDSSLGSQALSESMTGALRTSVPANTEAWLALCPPAAR